MKYPLKRLWNIFGIILRQTAFSLRVDIQKSIGEMQARCDAQLNVIKALQKPDMLEGKRRIHARNLGKYRVEAQREFCLFVSFWLLLAGFLAAGLFVVPLGVQHTGLKLFFASPPVSFVWLLATLALFSLFKKGFLPDLSWTWILITFILTVAGMLLASRFPEAAWRRYQALPALVMSDRMGEYYALICIAFLFNTMVIAAWSRMLVGMNLKIALLFLVPLGAYFIVLSAADSAGWGLAVQRRFLWTCGGAMLCTFAGFMAAAFASTLLIFYVFERRLRQEHPAMVIVADLLTAIFILETHDPKLKKGQPWYEWDEIAGRRLIAKRLESTASCIQTYLPRNFSLSNAHIRSLAQGHLDRMAYHFRSLKLWVLFSKPDTREYMLAHLESLLHSVVSGTWDALPRVDVKDMPPAKGKLEVITSLIVGFTPLLLVLMAGILRAENREILTWMAPDFMKYAVPLSVLWAYLSLSLAFDKRLGDKIAIFGNVLDLIKKPLVGK